MEPDSSEQPARTRLGGHHKKHRRLDAIFARGKTYLR